MGRIFVDMEWKVLNLEDLPDVMWRRWRYLSWFVFCQPQEKTSDGIRMIKDHNLREGKGWWQWCEVCEKEGNAALWMLLSFIFADVAECRYESDTVVETSLMQNIIVTESQQKLQWMWKSRKIMSVLKSSLETTLCESIEGKIQGSNSCHQEVLIGPDRDAELGLHRWHWCNENCGWGCERSEVLNADCMRRYIMQWKLGLGSGG